MALYYEPPDLILSPSLLLLSTIVGFEGTWETELATLIGYNVVKLTYHKSASGFSQDRIEAIANILQPPIVLSPRNQSDFGGGLGGTIVWEGPVQVVLFDQTDCGGEGYHVIGDTGQAIPMPLDILVAHELSHAFHNASGDSPSNLTESEKQAIGDENLHRAQQGLPLRDVDDHYGGCGPPPPWWVMAFRRLRALFASLGKATPRRRGCLGCAARAAPVIRRTALRR